MTPEEIIKQLGIQPAPELNDCEACRIERNDEPVKNQPVHTCGKDGDLTKRLNEQTKKLQPCNYTNCECIGCKAYRKEKGIPEPDPNAAYNAKVHEIAKILAKSIHGYAHENSPPEVQEEDIDYYIPSARVMVAKMAEVFADGYVNGYGDAGIYTSEEDPDIIAYQKERGLIPAKPENNA